MEPNTVFEFVKGLIRHGLTFGGGIVVSSGWASQGDTDIAIGAVMTTVGFVWSAYRKWRRARDEQIAREMDNA